MTSLCFRGMIWSGWNPLIRLKDLVRVSMRPLASPSVPLATAALARAVFPVGCLAMRLRDELGEVFTNADFVAAYPRRGGPALSPATLALVSVLQYAERLTDRQAAHAAAARIDWK